MRFPLRDAPLVVAAAGAAAGCADCALLVPADPAVRHLGVCAEAERDAPPVACGVFFTPELPFSIGDLALVERDVGAADLPELGFVSEVVTGGSGWPG